MSLLRPGPRLGGQVQADGDLSDCVVAVMVLVILLAAAAKAVVSGKLVALL